MKHEAINADWIAKRLDLRGDQARLAEHLGITEDKMSKILRGKRAVQADEVIPLLTFFGYTIIPPDDDFLAFYSLWQGLAKEERAFLQAAARGVGARGPAADAG